MKGYKGFEPGMICRGKQYAENTVYEENSAKICESGMHFCEEPFEVWRYYPPCDNNGNLNEFAEVESLAEEKTDDDMKFCTTKLKIGAKLSLANFIKAGVDFIIEKAKRDKKENTNTGYYSAATNTGYCSAATNTGDRSAATNTGDRSAATNTGNRSAATNTGNCSAATNTGYYSAATNTGYCSAATNTGNCSAATNTGYYSAATNTGDCSAATVEGEGSIAIVTGKSSKAKGSLGCWIVCTERDDDYKIICVKAAFVDGEVIKENTFYKLKDGEFMEELLSN